MKQRSTERSSACTTCGKTFARTDTLLRHEKSHLATEDRGPVHRVTNGTFRACRSCAQARSRCSGGSPCGRCKVRSLSCVYPNKRRKMTDEADGFETGERSSMHLRQSGLPNGTVTEYQQPTPAQFREIVFPQNFESSASDNRQSGAIPNKTGMQANSMIPEQNSNQLERQHNSINYDPSFQQTVDIQQHSQIQSDLHTMPESVVSNIPRNSYTNQTQTHDFSNPFAIQSTDYGFETPYHDPINLNWIPLSVYPSPYGDMDQDFSFLLPSFSDNASLGTALDAMQYDATVPPMIHHDSQGELLIPRSIPERKAANALLNLVQSPTSSSSNSQSAVPAYQGDSRFIEPKSRSRRSFCSQEIFTNPRELTNIAFFPDTTDLLHQNSIPSYFVCSDPQYSAIRHAFENICKKETTQNQFELHGFPDLTVLDRCVDLYFEHFHPTFPLLHYPSFDSSGTHWMVILAAAAVGSNFTSGSVSLELRIAFQEFLRRTIAEASYLGSDELHNFQIAQARILNLICMIQSYQNMSKAAAPQYHADLSRWCLESGILQLTTPDEELELNMSKEQKTQAWNRWIKQESARRAGYFVWLLDCSSGYMCNARPLCNMDDARAPLPCSETLWDTSSAEKWYERKIGSSPMPSLCAALEDMYSKKKVLSGMSDISHILLIHALYSRTWEVGTHIKQPLSEWNATGNSRGFLNTPSKDDFWLPLYPLYANWKNSACDCLDTLHWYASSVVARASGAEHHVVLHLHLARIILLTPFQEIQDLLFFLINHDIGEESKATYYVHDGSYQRRNLAKLPQIRKITSRWLREDQHKARLAIIHAGSIFWSVRRYSRNNFYEPLAVYLASIVLWTYGSYKSAALEREAANDNGHRGAIGRRLSHNENIQPTRVELAARHYRSSKSKSSYSSTSDQGINSISPANATNQQTANKNANNERSPNVADQDTESEDEENDQPTFIHLDRPCDDEIVQHFVRNGHNMSGYMSNVGDICKTPQKVLIEGARLLRGKLGAWGVSREYHDILIKLAERRGKDKA